MPVDVPPYVQGPLRERWDSPVSSLASLDARPYDAGARERHRIYALLVMALVHGYWNGNKRRDAADGGEYPWREAQRRPNGSYAGGQYLGHNIACVAVDGAGELIDFDFNHNDILSSSAEHAESRLVRRVFSLAQIYDDWETRDAAGPPRSADYANILSNVTVYTSLESCSQCAGIMALGKVKEVVYLQRDPGMYCIGNILYNLTHSAQPGAKPPLPAPFPVAAGDFGFEYFDALNDGFAAFQGAVTGRPFYRGADGRADASPSITSYLCTDAAREVFARAAAELDAFAPGSPDYVPPDPGVAPGAPVRTNAQALDHARRFLRYAVRDGRRGTPHKL